MPVDWRGSIVCRRETTPSAEPESQLWSELCKPTSLYHIQGNEAALAQMSEWFHERQQHRNHGNACLVVKGPCGVGKSIAVDLCAEDNGFHVQHTYANVSRTQQKLEGMLTRLTMHSQASVLVLDDFESFIYETTSLRDITRFVRAIGKKGGADGRRQTLVIICNDIDKSFQPVFDASTVIEFEAAEPVHVQRALRNVARTVSHSCYVPPMDIFFIAHASSGNINQTINQMQFSHRNTGRTRPKGPLRIGRGTATDTSFRNWFSTHRSTSLHCFTKAKEGIIDHVWSMSRGFHMGVRDHLHRDYPLYFHNSTCNTLQNMWKVAEEVSACDAAGHGDEDDRLYATENKDVWATDNRSAVAHLSTGIWLTRGRQRTPHEQKKRKRRRLHSQFRRHEETSNVFRAGKALDL